jgi:hypothetical protein
MCIYIYIYGEFALYVARAPTNGHQLVRLEKHGVYQTRITLTVNMHTYLNVALSIRNVLDNIRRIMRKLICGAV